MIWNGTDPDLHNLVIPLEGCKRGLTHFDIFKDGLSPLVLDPSKPSGELRPFKEGPLGLQTPSVNQLNATTKAFTLVGWGRILISHLKGLTVFGGSWLSGV